MYHIAERRTIHMSAEFIEGGYTIKVADHTPEHRNVYVARVSWMSGDADVYTYSTFIVEPKDLVRSITALHEALGHRIGSWRDASDVTPDIAWFFGGAITQAEYDSIKVNPKHDDYWTVEDTEDYQDYLDQVELGDWERDRSCDDCGNARLDGWKLTYYDNAGLPHAVEIHKGDEKITSSYWRE